MSAATAEQMDIKVLENRESVSEAIKYELKPTTKRLVLDRQTEQKSASEAGDGGNAWINGNTMVFEVSSDNRCIDPHTVYIRGDFSVTQGDGTALPNNVFPRLRGSISKCFDSIKVYFNDVAVEELTSFNLWSDIHDSTCLSGDYLLSQAQSEFLDDSKYDDDVTVSAVAVNNDPSVVAVADPGANDTVSIGTSIRDALKEFEKKIHPPKYETKEATGWIRNGREFVYPLFKYVGIFQQQKYLPLKFMGKLRIEIKLVNNGYNALTFPIAPLPQPAGASIRFRNMRLCFDSVRLNDELNLVLQEKIMKDGLMLDYRTYTTTNDTASTTSKAVKMNTSVADALSVYATIRNAGTIGTVAGDDTKFITGKTDDNKATGNAQPVTWQVQVGTDYFPKNQVNTFTQTRVELDKALAHFGNIQRGNTTYKEFCNNKFVIGVNLENDPVSSYTGRTTKDNQIELNLDNLSVIAAPDDWTKRIDLFVLYTRVLKISPDRVVNVYK